METHHSEVDDNDDDDDDESEAQFHEIHLGGLGTDTTTPHNKHTERLSGALAAGSRVKEKKGGGGGGGQQEDDDSFQEIALDAAPVEGLLHYHGRKSPNRR